jgi:hypothetical protein
VLASRAFNAHPQPLHVAGVRAGACRPVRAAGSARGDAGEARGVFAHYMRETASLQRPIARRAERRTAATSYLKLLQGWGLDANGAAGAVLKGWVESRFGLVPAFPQGAAAALPVGGLDGLPGRDKAGPLAQQQHAAAARPAVRVLPVDAGSGMPCWARSPASRCGAAAIAATSRWWPGRCANGAARCG